MRPTRPTPRARSSSTSTPGRGTRRCATSSRCLQRCVEPGMAKNTYGTGCFLLMNTGAQPVASRHGLVTTAACDARGGGAYALEGSVFIAGAAIQWLRDGLGLLKKAADSERLARSVD